MAETTHIYELRISINNTSNVLGCIGVFHCVVQVIHASRIVGREQGNA